MVQEVRMTLDEVVKATEVNRRNVRYYIKMRLVDPPKGRGRGAYYDQVHVEQLKRIKRLRRGGISIPQILKENDIRKEEAEAYAKERQENWMKYTLRQGIELHVRKDVEEKDKWMITRIIHSIRVIEESDQRKTPALNRNA
jgi:DNA-binding transcriptional MerR regulator